MPNEGATGRMLIRDIDSLLGGRSQDFPAPSAAFRVVYLKLAAERSADSGACTLAQAPLSF